MSECPPRNWIGASLRSIYASTLESPLPTGTAALVAKIEANLSLQTFAHDLTTMMPRLRAYARSLTRDSDAAEDLVQDTMLKAWKARDQFAPGTSLRAWTSTILRNLFMTQRRRARFNGDYDEQVAEIRLAHRETQSAIVELGDVRRAMEELLPDQREALRLVAIEGLSYEEGACQVGISLGSFKSRVWRGRSMLQSIINGDAVQSASVTHVKPPEAPTPPAKRPDRNGAWSAAKAAGRPFWIG